MSPPPAPNHGSYQAAIVSLLDRLMPRGRVLNECPISTADGVRAADAAWASPECLRQLGNRVCFPQAPEICAEVLSPNNTNAEIEQKMKFSFDAGAKEVWVCSQSGAINFFASSAHKSATASRLCPEFPRRVKLK